MTLECPNTECWQALFGDSLPVQQRERCERHLESCPACQARLDRAVEDGQDLLRLARQLGDPTLVAADATLVQVQQRVLQMKKTPGPPSTEPADLFFLRPSDQPGILGTLGDYQVQELIGQGGMGVVLAAYEPALHRLVAIKVLSPALAGSATARRRFIREAQAAAAVCHDHVVAVYAVRETDGLPYLVMQYVPGESLQERLDRSGPLELTEIVRIGLQTAQGLAAAHAQGLIHRDIKPANILLESPSPPTPLPTGARGDVVRVKITDFGLARMADDTALTQSGVVVGTPEYMSPEQARGELVDHRCDLFSLGSVLYAACTGHPPFRGSTAVSVLNKVSDELPAPIRSLNPDVPVWLEGLVNRLLAKAPGDRFESAAEVAELLERYLAHLRQPLTVPAPQVTPPPAWVDSAEKSTRRIWKHLGELALVLLAGFGLFKLLQVPAPLQPERPEGLYQDFRGGRKPLPPLLLVGPDARAVTRPDQGGMRITFPEIRENPDRVGIQLNSRLKGDFEVTAGYEILAGNRPREGHGVGFELFVATDSPAKEELGLFRSSRVVEGEVYLLSWSTIEQGERRYHGNNVPSSCKSGQLRITRVGSVATLSVAEQDSPAFRRLWTQEMGSADVTVVRASAYPGHAQNALDLLVKDLRVRTLSAIEANALAAMPDDLAEKKGRGWSIAAGLVLLAILAGGLIVWLAARRSRARSSDRAAAG